MKILAFDIATNTGWAFGDPSPSVEESGSFKFSGSFWMYYRECKNLIKLYKPTIIVTAEATRFYNAQRKMNMLCGAMRVAADDCKVSLYIEQRPSKGRKKASSGFPVDSAMKKLVFGKGKVSKEEICSYYQVTNEDQADAMMFIDYFNLKNKENAH